MNWHQYPLLRLAIPYVLGIAIVAFKYHPLFPSLPLNAILCMAFLSCFLIRFYTRYQSIAFGLFCSIFFFSLGMLRTQGYSDWNLASHFKNSLDTANFFIAEIETEPTEKPHSIKLILTMTSIQHQNFWKKSLGSLLTYLEKDTMGSLLHKGDLLIANGSIQEISAPANPGDFDYRKYLFQRNVFHQVFLEKEKWSKLRVGCPPPWIAWTDKTRAGFLNVLKEYHLEGDEFAVLAALLIGYQDKIDPETLRNFSGAGVVHILSVSGMHIGVLYLALSYLLGFLKKYKSAHRIRGIIILLILWFYAAITGMAPCVLRATVMFSLVLIAEILWKKTNIFQSLIVSAFLLLLYNPYFLFDTGFQLSYLAVIGIVMFQKKIQILFLPKNKWLKMTWDLIAVSVAAQLTTLPLTLLYFHQFPTYFIPANLLAIPFTNILMAMGVVLVLVSPLSWLANQVGWLLSKALSLFNISIAWINHWPAATIRQIHFDYGDALILAASLIVLFLWLQNKKKIICNVLIVSLSLIFCKQIFENILLLDRKSISIYAIKGNHILSALSGNTAYIVTDSLCDQNSACYIQHLATHLCQQKVNETKFLNLRELPQAGIFGDLFVKPPLICFFNKKIFLLDSCPEKRKYSLPFPVDILWLRAEIREKPEEIVHTFSPRHLVMGLNLRAPFRKKWKAMCISRKILYTDLKTSGAFTLEW